MGHDQGRGPVRRPVQGEREGQGAGQGVRGQLRVHASQGLPISAAGRHHRGPVPGAVLDHAAGPGDRAGWAGNKNAQIKAAEHCTNAATCSHLDYTGGTEIYEGALFVVSQLVG